MSIIVKKDKKLINDGGHKPFGLNLDPDKELCHITTPDKDVKGAFKKIRKAIKRKKININIGK